MTRKHRIALATGLLLSFLTWAPAQADFQAGLDAYNRGAYEKALPHLLRAADCPRAAQRDTGAWNFDLFASPELDRYHRPRATGGFTEVMDGLRSHAIVSLYFLPGEAVVAAGRESAGLLGAKQVAYGIDAVRNPGNDLLYMMVAMLSWVGLYKLLMAIHGLLHRISDFSAPLDVGGCSRRRRKKGPHHGHAG